MIQQNELAHFKKLTVNNDSGEIYIESLLWCFDLRIHKDLTDLNNIATEFADYNDR